MDKIINFTRTNYIYVGVALASAALLWLGRRYFDGPWTPIKRKMEGKTVIVTGSNTGMGFATAEDILLQGGNVIFACRDEKKTLVAIKTLPEECQKRAKFIKLDLCDFSSVYQSLHLVF